MATSDTDTIFDDKPLHGGEYGLWLRVVTDAVVHLLKYRSNTAREFLFDRDNPFFDFVCERMGYDADAVRERIRRTASQDAPGGAIRLRDGQDAGEMLLDIEARIGELLPSREEAISKGSKRGAALQAGRGTVEPGRPADITEKHAHYARTIKDNPVIVAKIKAQARENEDIPSGAGGNVKSAQRAESKIETIKKAGIEDRSARKSSEVFRNPAIVARIKAHAREEAAAPARQVCRRNI